MQTDSGTEARGTRQRLLRIAEFLGWAVFFVAAGVILVLRYWILPNVEHYRDDIVAAASRATGLAVQVDRISADWRGLRPRLELVNVRLYDARGREALLLPSVVNVIAWRSLVFFDLRLHSFEVEDLKLSVRRDAQGAISVGGIVLQAGEKGDGRVTDWVLGQREIVLRNAEIEWTDELRGAPPLRLSALNFRLQNDGDEHAAGFSARPPRELGASVEVRAELVGRSITEPRAWNGRLYAEVGNTDLAAWRAWLDYPVDVRSGEGALRVWASLAEGRLRRIAADLALANVVAQLGPELPLLQLSSLRGRLAGRNTPTGFELATRELRFRDPHGPPMQATTLRLAVERAAGGVPMKGSFVASRLEFEPLSRVAESLPLPADVRRMLVELAPRGVLLDASVDWRGEAAQPESFSARGRFVDLGMRARGRIPGFSGLSGTLEASEARGTLNLTATDARIDLPAVFSQSQTRLDALSGQVGWEIPRDAAGTAGPLRFRLSNLSFANAALEGTAFGTYTWTGKGPGVIDLTAHLSRADASQAPRYMPLVLSAGLREWLSRAVVAGVSKDVRVRLRGDLYDFPFVDPAKGQFQVAARVSKGVLDYAPGWPRIEGIEADLLFERDKAEFIGRKASIFGAALSAVRVSIPELNAGLIHISGQAEGPTADFLRYTRQSPVRRMVSGFTDAMQATGRGRLRLKLDLPLADLDRTTLSGQYQFSANNLVVDARLPPIERATGRLDFSESALTIGELRGALFGGQVSVGGGTRPDGGVLVTARGNATVTGMRELFDHPWRRYLSGGAPYTASVSVAGGKSRIVFESPLTGVKSELPAPLSKSATQTLPLRVEVTPADGGDSIRLAVAKVVNAQFQRQRQGAAMLVRRIGVGFNTPAQMPEGAGVLLSGNLPGLNVDDWLPVINDDATVAGSGSHGAGTGTTNFDLKLGALDVFGKRLNEAGLRGTADRRGWQANIVAQEMSGDLAYRDEGRGRLRARLDRFRPPEATPGAKPAGDAHDLPAVDLIADRFEYRGKQLGRIEVVAEPEGVNWRIDRIANVNPEAVLTGKGLWLTGAQSRTSLSFSLDVNDAGKYLDRVATPGALKGGTAKLSGNLTWAGEPLNLDYASLSGRVSLEAERGQFLEIEPGVGKLVSLISLQMLPRRIALDFKDVFSKGFAFDRMTSSLQIEKGVMSTSDFKMTGPAADVAIEGSTDLSAETQKLHVRVVPALGGSASTLVGLLNPVYGVASLIAQALLKNPLGNIFAFEYAVDGRWSDPKVEKLRVVPVDSIGASVEQFR